MACLLGSVEEMLLKHFLLYSLLLKITFLSNFSSYWTKFVGVSVWGGE